MGKLLDKLYGILPAWTLTVVFVAVILVLTLFKAPQAPDVVKLWPHADKCVHALMFGALFFVAAIERAYARKRSSKKLFGEALMAIFAWCALLGAVIELVQPYFHRSCDPADFLADVAGILAAWPFAWRAARQIHNNNSDKKTINNN